MKIIKETRNISTSSGWRKALLLRPAETSGQRPGVLWIHGGGYATGMPEMAFFSRPRDLVEKHGAVVLSPAYRLSWQAPYPAALDDCYAALRYLRDCADELGVRSDQIMVGGESAGGGLCAALCMLARDKGEISIAYHMPLYPMLDCDDTESSRDNHGRIWNTRRNHAAWKLYLRKLYGKPGISPYASPAKQTNYAGLPPAYSFVSEGEPFYAETLAYIENLRRAGVAAAVDVYPGNTHAFDMMRPHWRVSKQAAQVFNERFRFAAANCFAPQPVRDITPDRSAAVDS